MDKKPPEADKHSSPSGLLKPDESKKILTHFWGCIALILVFGLLLYWIVETLKAWW